VIYDGKHFTLPLPLAPSLFPPCSLPLAPSPLLPPPCSLPGSDREPTEYGCYIDKYGKPVRNCKFVRWEIKAKTFSYRHPHLLLFGDDFIDIRHAPTGQFKQMVEAKNIRLLDSIGIGGWKGSLFLEWRGSHNDTLGQSWALVEGLETAPLEIPKTPPPLPPPFIGNLPSPIPLPIPEPSPPTRTRSNADLWDEWA
jgi:hypothetical protein